MHIVIQRLYRLFPDHMALIGQTSLNANRAFVLDIIPKSIALNPCFVYKACSDVKCQQYIEFKDLEGVINLFRVENNYEDLPTELSLVVNLNNEVWLENSEFGHMLGEPSNVIDWVPTILQKIYIINQIRNGISNIEIELFDGLKAKFLAEDVVMDGGFFCINDVTFIGPLKDLFR